MPAPHRDSSTSNPDRLVLNAVLAAARHAVEKARERYDGAFKHVMGDDEESERLLDGYATALLCSGEVGSQLADSGLRIQMDPGWPDPGHTVTAFSLSTGMKLRSHKGTWEEDRDDDTTRIDDGVELGPILVFDRP